MRHGKPAQILTDHGSQFYANKKNTSKWGVAAFETKLAGIKQVMALKAPTDKRQVGEVSFGDTKAPEIL